MRSIIFIIVVLLALAVSAAVWGAPTAAITVPSAGDYYYWFVYTSIDGTETTTTPRGFKDKKVTVDLPLVKDAVPEECTLYVLDAATGNEAVMKVDSKSTDAQKYDLKTADFDRVRRVEVQVTAASTRLPAAAATVKIEDSEEKAQTQVLDPSAGGSVRFLDVASGTAKVTVEYGEGKSTSQDVDIPLDRDEIIPLVTIPVVGEVETIEVAESGDADGTAGRTSPQSPGQGINFPTAVVGLILLAGIVYLAVNTMRNRGAGFRQIMGKLGVDLPGEPEVAASIPAAPAPQIDPSVCPFCGGKKDPATGECACSVGPGAAASAGASSGPRLVATQGTYIGGIYPLGAEGVSIGRDETNGIAFPQDNTASRRHARIAQVNGGFTIYDEGSSNGTFVNGVKVTEQALRSGDEIQIGGTRLRFET